MAKQDDRKPFEAQSEPLMPVPPGPGAHHKGL